MVKIEKGNGWYHDVEADRYEKKGFIVTGTALDTYMKNWGRKIETVHIVAVLDKIYKENMNL